MGDEDDAGRNIKIEIGPNILELHSNLTPLVHAIAYAQYRCHSFQFFDYQKRECLEAKIKIWEAIPECIEFRSALNSDPKFGKIEFRSKN